MEAARQNRQVRAGPLDVRAAQRNDVIVFWDRALLHHHRGVPQEEHWVVVADRRLHQPFGIVWRRRHANLDAWMMNQCPVRQRRMLVPDASADSTRPDHHHRQRMLAAVQEVVLADLQHNLGCRVIREAGIHVVHDRPQAFLGRTHSAAGHSGFRNWRVEDAVLSELLCQAFCMRKCRGLNAGSYQKHTIVAPHLFGVGFANRLGESEFSTCTHPPSSSPVRRWLIAILLSKALPSEGFRNFPPGHPPRDQLQRGSR